MRPSTGWLASLLAVLTLTAPLSVSAAQDDLMVHVAAPYPKYEIEVCIDKGCRRATLDDKGETAIQFPAPEKKHIDFTFTTKTGGEGSVKLLALDLVGSGVLQFILGQTKCSSCYQVPRTQVTLYEWPQVTFAVTKETWDVAVNKRMLGTTEVRRPISPGKVTVRYSRGDTLACEAQVNLPEAVRRRLVCDPSTGKVSVQ